MSKSSRPSFVGLRPLAGCTRSSSDGCRPMPSGPVAQWIRHRPTEPGIVGSSPTRIIWLFHSVTAEKPCAPTAKAAEMAGSSGHTEIPDSPKRCLCGRGGLKIGAAKAGTLPKQGWWVLRSAFRPLSVGVAGRGWLFLFFVCSGSRPAEPR